MSDHDEVMERLDWLVDAVTALLVNAVRGGADPDAPALTLPPRSQAADPVINDPDPAPPSTRPPTWCPFSPTGTHTSQEQDQDGNLVCAKCRYVLVGRVGVVAQGQRAPWLATKED